MFLASQTKQRQLKGGLSDNYESFTWECGQANGESGHVVG